MQTQGKKDESELIEDEKSKTGIPHKINTLSFTKKNKFQPEQKLPNLFCLGTKTLDFGATTPSMKMHLLDSLQLKTPFQSRQTKDLDKRNYSDSKISSLGSKDEDVEIFSEEISVYENDCEEIDSNRKRRFLSCSFHQKVLSNDCDQSQIDTIIKCLKDIENGKVSSLMGKFSSKAKIKKNPKNLNLNGKGSSQIIPKDFSEFLLLVKHKSALEKFLNEKEKPKTPVTCKCPMD